MQRRVERIGGLKGDRSMMALFTAKSVSDLRLRQRREEKRKRRERERERKRERRDTGKINLATENAGRDETFQRI